MNTLGLRHVAVQVSDPQLSKAFYTDVLRMEVEWEPDPDNVYLTNGGHDNLALHRAPAGDLAGVQRLDHIGFAVPEAADVDAWHDRVVAHGCPIVHPPRTHRDGARSFYFSDPDRLTVQIIHHPPISARSSIKT